MRTQRSDPARFLAIVAITFGQGMLSQARAQAGSSDASTAAMHQSTNDDKTASASIPDGWKFGKGSNGYVYITGPNDERLNLGAIFRGEERAGGGRRSG
jgi:hypothetical protein